MRIWFLITTLLLATSVPSFNSVALKAAGDAVVEVPFAFEAGHVIVAATIKNDMPVAFILSTGAEHSSFDFALLEKYKLQAYYTGVGIITGHNDKTVTFTRVPDLRLGGLHLTSLDMRLVSLDGLSKRSGREIAGILGADFFRGRIAQFDFAHKVLRFLPNSEAVAAPKSAGASHRYVLAMNSLEGGLAIPIVNSVMINGKKFKTLFDTGAVTVVSVSASGAKQIGLTAPPEKEPPRVDKLASFRLDENEPIADLPVMVYAKGSDFDRDQLEFGAVVGTILLQNFTATFDFRKKVIILDR